MRRREKEERRANSKKNFVPMGYAEVPMKQLQHDENLKECDMEIVDLIGKRMDWAEQGLVTNDYSKAIILKGCSYLDSLCSLRFDITPNDDKVSVRNIMYYIGNATKMFIAMIFSEDFEPYENDMTIAEVVDEGKWDVPILSDFYPLETFPKEEIVDDIYASFVAKHAETLASFLQNTRKSQIISDEDYIIEVLQMIVKKTDELLPEAQVDSVKFAIQL